MLRISKRFDVHREFRPVDKRLISALVKTPKPSEPISPGAIYTSPEISKELPPPPAPAKLRMESPRMESPRMESDSEYLIGTASLLKTDAPPGFIEKMAPAKNFLDIFFDWLNKFLSGK